MKRCYRCGCELKRKTDCSEEEVTEGRYASKEHVIPYFLGFGTTSYDLLCKRCNSLLGSDVDGVLSKELIISKFIGCDRNGNSTVQISGRSEDEIEYLISNEGIAKLAKPQVIYDEDGSLKQVAARNEQEAYGYLKSLAKKDPNIKPDELIKNFRMVGEGDVSSTLFFDHHKLGSENTYRAVAKIALNMYLHYQQALTESIEPFVNCVLGKEKVNSFVSLYYPLPFVKIYVPDEDEISNVFHLVGDPKWHLLYLYAEFYNVSNFIAVLDRNYSGVSFTETKIKNLLTNKMIEGKRIDLGLCYSPVPMVMTQAVKDRYQEQHKLRFSRVVELLNKIRRMR